MFEEKQLLAIQMELKQEIANEKMKIAELFSQLESQETPSTTTAAVSVLSRKYTIFRKNYSDFRTEMIKQAQPNFLMIRRIKLKKNGKPSIWS